jgi:hypothetical protein
MVNEINEILTKTYNNLILRRKTVPLFMSDPGTGKSTIIRKFANDKNVNYLKITLSQRMPNEVSGGVMPDLQNNIWRTLDNGQLANLKDGDILHFDEVFNGTLKQTLDSFLNLIEDRVLPSGKPLADVMIIASSNPQGLINITPQIKERFVRYDLYFNSSEFNNHMKDKYGMPFKISQELSNLIIKEKFESNWNYNSGRSLEKAMLQIGYDLISPYTDLLIPILTESINCPIDLKSLDIKKDDEIPYLTLLRFILKEMNDVEIKKLKDKNDTENKKSNNRITTNMVM